jgi:signal transduction histidine kinase
LQAIFNASPVPLSVVSADDQLFIRDVNDAWCRALQRTREQSIGHSVMEIGLWRAREMLDTALTEMQDGRTSTDTWMVRGDGQEILMQAFGGKTTVLATEQLVVWALVEIGPLRRIEHELQELNQQLESRVEQRTQALAAAHDALSETVAQLSAAQDELVRTEKLAALGKLVASVAHEVNTPLGNGVMAVSALADSTRSFKRLMQAGLKRADLQQYVISVVQGSDIAGRNLRRAAELVQSFKQVAVDQTSAQRRSFELSEVVHEIVVSLRPSLNRTPYRIEVDVPDTGLRLNSYPGALGQALVNLIQNAVAHGFEGRDHGTVRIAGLRDATDDRIVLRVADDGRGIPAALLPSVFEPFVTSKADRGGTGLGLHITHNAIVELIRGTLTVASTEGQGTVFEMRLPAQPLQT